MPPNYAIPFGNARFKEPSAWLAFCGKCGHVKEERLAHRGEPKATNCTECGERILVRIIHTCKSCDARLAFKQSGRVRYLCIDGGSSHEDSKPLMVYDRRRRSWSLQAA